MSAFSTHFAFEFKTGIRNKNLLLMNYLFPLSFYLMMGFIMTEINPQFKEIMIPAMVIFAILVATFLGLPDPLVSARESGIFRSYKINGVPAFSILFIPALTTGMHMAIITMIITISAPFLFDVTVPTNGLNMFLVLFAISIACSGLGVLIGVVSPSVRMTVLYSQVIFVPSMLLAGLMMPFSLLPEGAQMVAQLLPATHGMNALNGLAMGFTPDFNPWASVAMLIASGLLAFGLALYLFSWDNKNSSRRGHPALALLAFMPYLIGILFLS